MNKDPFEVIWQRTTLDPEGTVVAIDALLEENGGDISYEYCRGRVYVDAGLSTAKCELVRKGLTILESLIGNKGITRNHVLLIHIANGYLDLWKSEWKKNLVHQHYGYDAIQKAKKYFRMALRDPNLDDSLRLPVLINYANCLADMGRTSEAIEIYKDALAIQPGYAMTTGNIGMELIAYGDFARDNSILEEARKYLTESLAGNLLEESGHGHHRIIFETKLKIAEEKLTARVDGPKVKPWTESGNIYVNDYVRFCHRNRLFLNFSLSKDMTVINARDVFHPRILMGLDEDDRAIRLTRAINEIKERYATCRYILFEAKNPRAESAELNLLTRYAYNNDYGLSSIRGGWWRRSERGPELAV